MQSRRMVLHYESGIFKVCVGDMDVSVLYLTCRASIEIISLSMIRSISKLRS